MQNNTIGIRVKRLANFVLISGFLGLVVAGECAAESLAVAPSEIGNNSASIKTADTFSHRGDVGLTAGECLPNIDKENAKPLQPVNSIGAKYIKDEQKEGYRERDENLHYVHSFLLFICAMLSIIMFQMPSKIK